VLARGHAALRDTYGKLFARAPGPRADLVARTGLGPWVIDRERLTVAGD
jgi:hypothetical protein